jgi:hypothetical protein
MQFIYLRLDADDSRRKFLLEFGWGLGPVGYVLLRNDKRVARRNWKRIPDRAKGARLEEDSGFVNAAKYTFCGIHRLLLQVLQIHSLSPAVSELPEGSCFAFHSVRHFRGEIALRMQVSRVFVHVDGVLVIPSWVLANPNYIGAPERGA